MKYRREIDGLRAVAVLPVILFHAGFSAFSGGFIGVDVFFVISGYLITTIILAEKEKGTFSLIRFYERRARRILPALFFVMLCCVPFAWFWLSPNHFKDFSRSLFSVSVFSSNISFWLESGYFATAAELKPLLHTWSLAVEEQYYVLFPLFLMFMWKLRKRWIFGSLMLIAVTSLAVAQWGAYNKPLATFYLLPTRGWELAIGALIAFYFLYKKDHAVFVTSNKAINEFLGFVGMALICYSIFSFDKATPFPSLYALIPTIGTGLIIVFTTSQTLVGRFLGTKTMVGIGLISYSTYLWHQPLFVFARHLCLTEPGTFLLIFLSVFSILLAYISWRYVECPFRDKNAIGRKGIFGFALVGSLVFVSIGGAGYLNEGFRPETPSSVVDYSSGYKKNVSRTVLIGDSHARHLYYGLTELLSSDVYNLSATGCIPFYNVDRYDSRFVPGECAKKMNVRLDTFVSKASLKNLIISNMGPVYLDGTPFRGKDKARVTGLGVELVNQKDITDRWQVFEIGMRNTFDRLTEDKEKNIIFVIDVPELGLNNCSGEPKKEINIFGATITDMRNAPGALCKIPRSEFDERVERYHELVYKVSRDYPEVQIFDPTELFCDQDWCYGYKDNVGFLYRDIDHLSSKGSVYVARHILPLLE